MTTHNNDYEPRGGLYPDTVPQSAALGTAGHTPESPEDSFQRLGRILLDEDANNDIVRDAALDARDAGLDLTTRLAAAEARAERLAEALSHVLARYDARNAERHVEPWDDDGKTKAARAALAAGGKEAPC